MKKLIDEILQLEWAFFQETSNEGGPASCQESFDTFEIIRGCQFAAWNEKLLNSYKEDLLEAREMGRNLIAEKYGRMMKSTCPERYEEIKMYFPVHDEERTAIMEQIIAIQVEWLEEFKALYPEQAVGTRLIHTAEDTEFNTSAETYLRGELATYSGRTLLLYGRHIVALKQQGLNLSTIIFTNTAKSYGYESLEAAKAVKF